LLTRSDCATLPRQSRDHRLVPPSSAGRCTPRPSSPSSP